MAEPLVNSLRRIRRRVLVVRALEAGLLAALGAAPVAAAVAVVRIVRPESVPLAAAYPVLPLALLACGFVLGFLVRLAMGVSLRQAAIVADHAGGLKERLATALEVLGRTSQGELDARLLEQAAEAASAIDPSRLPLARTAGRSAKALLVAVLVLVAAAFVPPVGGPPVPRQTAERAAEALRSWAAGKPDSVSPEIREQIRRTVQALTEAGLRQSTADEATRAAVATAVRVESSRKATLAELRKAGSPEIEAMARAAAGGDAAGALSAAEKAAGRLAPLPGSPPAPEAERSRVAAGLSGAAAVARGERFEKLADALTIAARAIRRADADATIRALRDVAGQMTRDLGDFRSAGVQDLIAAIGEARRAMGLAELPAFAPAPVGGEAAVREYPAAPAAGSNGDTPRVAGPVAEGQGAAAPATGAEVRPEDRDVVRRYFGG